MSKKKQAKNNRQVVIRGLLLIVSSLVVLFFVWFLVSSRYSLSKHAACLSSADWFIPQGASHTFQCVHFYSDGGQSCISSDSCQGDCIVKDIWQMEEGVATQGVCKSNDSKAGCISVIEDNGLVTCTD